MRRRGIIFVGIVAGLVASALAAQDEIRLEPAAADLSQLRDVVAEHRVQTVAERPGMAEYLRDVGEAFYAWLASRLESFGPGWLETLGAIVKVSAQVLFVLALGGLAALLIRAFVKSYGRRRSRPTNDPPLTPARADDGADEGAGRTRRDWSEELGRALERGDVAAACEALWWWLARTLVRGAVERSWTSRELLVRAGRRDLAPGVRRLDRMIYGAATPTPGDVRRLWHDLEEAAG